MAPAPLLKVELEAEEEPPPPPVVVDASPREEEEAPTAPTALEEKSPSVSRAVFKTFTFQTINEDDAETHHWLSVERACLIKIIQFPVPQDSDVLIGTQDADVLIAPDSDVLIAQDSDVLIAPDADVLIAPQDADVLIAPDADVLIAPQDADVLIAPDSDVLIAPQDSDVLKILTSVVGRADATCTTKLGRADATCTTKLGRADARPLNHSGVHDGALNHSGVHLARHGLARLTTRECICPTAPQNSDVLMLHAKQKPILGVSFPSWSH